MALTTMTDEWFEKQWDKIEVALDKYERDPSWTNKAIVECMMLDYEAKQKLNLNENQKTISSKTLQWQRAKPHEVASEGF
jgi:thymidylate synthase ThyX